MCYHSFVAEESPSLHFIKQQTLRVFNDWLLFLSTRGSDKEEERIRPPKIMSERLFMSRCDQGSLLGSHSSPKARRYSRIKHCGAGTLMQDGFLVMVMRSTIPQQNKRTMDKNKPKFQIFHVLLMTKELKAMLRASIPPLSLQKVMQRIIDSEVHTPK